MPVVYIYIYIRQFLFHVWNVRVNWFELSEMLYHTLFVIIECESDGIEALIHAIDGSYIKYFSKCNLY